MSTSQQVARSVDLSSVLVTMESQMIPGDEAVKLEIEVTAETPELDSESLVVSQSSYQHSNKHDDYKYTNNNRIKDESDDHQACLKCDLQNEHAPTKQKLESEIEFEEMILKNEHDFDTSMDGNSNIVLNRIKDESKDSDASKKCDVQMDMHAYIKLERNSDIEKLIDKKITEGTIEDDSEIVLNGIKDKSNDSDASNKCDVQMNLHACIKLERNSDIEKLTDKITEGTIENADDSEIVLNRIKDKPNDSDALNKCDVRTNLHACIKLERNSDIEKLTDNKITEGTIENADDPEIVLNRIKDESNDSDASNKCDVQMNLHAYIKLERNSDTEKLIDKTITKGTIEDDSEIVLNRIKDESNDSDASNKCDVQMDMQAYIKLERNSDIEKLIDKKITEGTIEHEDDSEIVFNSFEWLSPQRELPNTVSKKTRKKSFVCFNCNYATNRKQHLISHMKQHQFWWRKFANPHSLHISAKLDETFNSTEALNDDTVEKHELYKCTHCGYGTRTKSIFDRHILKHTESPGSPYINRCKHCDATFKKNETLEDHIVKKHPDFIASVSRKIHTCTHCTYKTILLNGLTRHMSKHSEASGKSGRGIICVHCKVTFKRSEILDEHIVKKHPEFIDSVSRKIFECKQCTYKSIRKSHVDKHVLRSHERSGLKLNKCSHCKESFRKKQNLDDHIIKKHPDFIASVSHKIHQCTQCEYKTTRKDTLVQHMASHAEAAGSCPYCDMMFKLKRNLEAHIAKKHPKARKKP
ncbi:unnamed protein product [Callosobruchus maculatus]|uniref:C2H2-type domain-containing protein n=1 Tax=Callosobruchus maculatus TaxID=64391 RepID=A0A653CF01_CALMS|nr:unnamed protein product [Callosobruchus maculatus]VEN46516.1 unnamed protein product [Callosobruchus maculatus]